MNFDNSRCTFNELNDYFGVIIEQGRVQVDADWNEWVAELRRRIQAGTLDTLGHAVYPSTTPNAFQISASAGPKIMIGPGRMYVDGLLVENHGDSSAAVWDPALEEMSNTPEPPSSPPAPAPARGAIDYTLQPYFPNAPQLNGDGPFIAFLDVWTRPVTYLEDSNLIDPAVNVDTAGRLQTVWQVKLVPPPEGTTPTCGSMQFPAPSSGLLSTTTTPNAPAGPCCITDSSGYTGMENQFYRVEIHQPGQPPAVPTSLPFTYPLPTGATFKFSRDNGSVQTAVTAINPNNNSAGALASQLTVLSLGRDQTLGFHPGDWIEILDDVVELSLVPKNGPQGQLYQIDSVDPSGPYIQLTQPINLPPPYTFPSDPTTTHTRIVRWDQNGKIYKSDGTTPWVDLGANNSTGEIPVPPPGTNLILENGVTVSFSQTSAATGFLCGDFWNFAARTATGNVETLNNAPPRGIHHHYAPLAIISSASAGTASDCRTEWPPATTAAECCCCCSVTVGGTQYPTIKSAIQAVAALPSGGEVCIPPGIYYENVFVEKLKDIVIRGCGWQTRIASESLKPAPPPADPTAGAPHDAAAVGGPNTDTPPFAAVITISQSQHVKLLSFAVEAAEDEVGVLIDGTGELRAAPQNNTGAPNVLRERIIIERAPTLDVTVEDLVITASTVPAILADTVKLLQIESNRVAMENVRSRWPAVWVSGNEIRIVHNWVGIQSQDTVTEWLPAIVGADLNAEQNPSRGAAVITSDVLLHPGGIQIAARATDVYVIDNEIDGGGLNGITLGSLTTTDSDGNETGQVIGVLVNPPDPCSTTSTLLTGESGSGSQTGLTVVAGGALRGIQIERNRIRCMGLCGIGPVGFFDLDQTTEVISVTNLEITGNTIQKTLLAPFTPSTQFGYGAICLPDVQNVIVRDNTVTDFGNEPGVEVCGIYILHGEMIEINRNQVNESRTWDEPLVVSEQQGVPRGGIYVTLATPPAFSSTANISVFTSNRDIASTPLYQPAMPALRVEHNVVRVPLNVTLYALGMGPFSIVDNHLSCGGTVSSGLFEIADTVLIMNLGLAIDIAGLFSNFSQVGSVAGTMETTNYRTNQQTFPLGGTVLFTNNVCQLEKVTGQFALASVMILSLDQIVFSNNQCWVDGAFAALVDAVLLAATVQVTGNRFQESLVPLAAAVSGVTLGLMSVTADNISTLCLLAFAPPTARVYANNISLLDLAQPGICENEWGTTFKVNR